MHVIGEQALGIILIVLFVIQGIIMAMPPSTTRGLKSKGGISVLIHVVFGIVCNAVFTFIAAVLLIMGVTGPIEATQIQISSSLLLTVVEVVGIVLIFYSYPFFWWGKLSLGQCIENAAVAPQKEYELVVKGAYRFVRNPIYSAGLWGLIGIMLVTQSVVFLLLFTIELIATLKLISIEEKQLETAYGDKYLAYRRQVKALFPFIY